MKLFDDLQGLDIYLLDQFLKGRIDKESRILDAGCGSGRNIHLLLREGYNITGIDPNIEAINGLKLMYPNHTKSFYHSSIEDFKSEVRFDFIICNAVLHFADTHEHFQRMFEALQTLLTQNGVLFIRMTSDIGLSGIKEDLGGGKFMLPDASVRYLLTRIKIDELLSTYKLSLMEPVKTVNVDELRCMTTLVLSKL